MYTWILVFFTVFLKNRNIISKMKRSKVTYYAALTFFLFFFLNVKRKEKQMWTRTAKEANKRLALLVRIRCGLLSITTTAHSCMTFFLYKRKCFFIKETDTFSHIVVWTIYTSHIDHYAPTYSFWAIRSMFFNPFRVTAWFDTVCNIVTGSVNLRKKKQLHEHGLLLSDYNIYKYFRPNVQNSGRKIYIYNFCLRTFQGQNEKL